MARQFIETELGIELKCSCCGEFYPADKEFFYRCNKSKWGFHSWCKACYESNDKQIAKRERWKNKNRTHQSAVGF
ncbi:hypothetical protein L4F92_07605 [Avibacterium sp. 21-595]|uniref:hypothetical protein n=1 Tax=Avibacterium sp. 21-595 TaxID=2911527 RepID=UPI002026D5DE|nr:hypothetical protein [Avibacterium sp. 21-595]URL05938.1 hypothetical protein L4F92_07605 [Avibacterium sp. 21-595]